MVLDHIGIVVRELAPAIREWDRLLGYRQFTEVVTNSRQKVKVVFLYKQGSTTVKLIEPTEPASPVHQFSLRGGGLHHLCFRCGNVEEETARLQSLGFRVLSPPEPGEAFGNNPIAFVYVQSIGLNLELIDTIEKAGRLDPTGGET